MTDLDLLLAAGRDALAAPGPSPALPVSIDGVRARLSRAARPMLLLGGAGWSDEACAEMTMVAGANALAVCCAAGHPDLIDNESPCYVGTLGPGSDPRLRARVTDADVLLAVGGIPPDMADHPGLLPIAGTVTAAAAALASMAPVDEVPWTDWVIAARQEHVDWAAADPWPGPLDLGAILGWLRERLPTDAVVAADPGGLAALAQRHLLFRRPGRLVTGREGQTGFGAAAAAAARLDRPRRMALGLTDAAGLAAAAPLLALATEAKAAVLVVAVNEGDDDLAGIARAHGAFAVTVGWSPDFIQAFWDALWSRTAAVIELRVDAGQIATQTIWDAARAAAMTQSGG